MLRYVILGLLLCAVLAGRVNGQNTNSASATSMTLEQAVLITIENNIALRIQRIEPEITQQNEAISRDLFDPKFTAGFDYGNGQWTAGTNGWRSADDLGADLGISKQFSTGTMLELGVDIQRDETTAPNADDKLYTDSVGAELRLTQSLLQGRGRDVNLASVHKAQITTAISKQKLRRYVETLIYNVTTAYWNLFLEQKKLTVYQESYDLALAHEREVEIFIRNGQMAEIELATVQGESSARREKLIQARGAIDKKRLSLLSILNYHRLASDSWNHQVDPIDNPVNLYEAPGDVELYVNVAMLKRPEIEEAELKIKRQQVEFVSTKNGLLPKLDFFIELGGTDYANSFNQQKDTETREYSVMMGVDFGLSFGRRADRARHQQSILGEQRETLSMQNLKDSISQEVRQAYIDCMTDHETIDAVAVTQELRGQSLKTQSIKFELGKATNTDIANAQRDLLQSQINYTEAVVDYVKSRLRLHYLDGSLIERSGLVIPFY